MSVPMLSGGQKAFASSGDSHSLSTPLARFACRIRFSICASCTRVREHHDAARRVHDVVVELLREVLPQLHRVVVDRDALVEQVVRADDGRVAAGVAAADPALLDDRDVGESVLGGEVIGRAEAVAAAADDDRVVRGLGLGLAPLLAPAPVPAEAAPQQAESGPGLPLHAGRRSMLRNESPRMHDFLAIRRLRIGLLEELRVELRRLVAIAGQLGRTCGAIDIAEAVRVRSL